MVSETGDSFARSVSTNVSMAGLYIKISLGPVPRADLVSDSDHCKSV